jgi:predicted nicotinamide N-methyase
LNDVGLQFWNGSLLLGDFVLSHPELFRDRVVLELGCGVGYAGLIAAGLARHVFLTDYDDTILENCRANVERNTHWLTDGHNMFCASSAIFSGAHVTRAETTPAASRTSTLSASSSAAPGCR